MSIKVKHKSSKIRYHNPTRPKTKVKKPWRFYVYMWLRGKDSVTGKKGTPYYVGKGFDKRAYRKGGPVDKSYVVIVESGMLEDDAFALEIELIARYGRVDLETGILRNKTDGGEGVSGWVATPETRKNMSLAAKGNNVGTSPAKTILDSIYLGRVGIDDVRWATGEIVGATSGYKHKDESIKLMICNLPDRNGDKNHFYNRTHSQESKQLIADKATIRMQLPTNMFNKNVIINDIMFNSINDAAKYFNLSRPTIHKIIYGKHKNPMRYGIFSASFI